MSNKYNNHNKYNKHNKTKKHLSKKKLIKKPVKKVFSTLKNKFSKAYSTNLICPPGMIADKDNRCIVTKYNISEKKNNLITKDKINKIRKFSYTKLTAPKKLVKSTSTPLEEEISKFHKNQVKAKHLAMYHDYKYQMAIKQKLV